MNVKLVRGGSAVSTTMLVSSWLLLGLAWGRPDVPPEAPKYTIKEVMAKAHGKNNLVKKLALGTATEVDKKTLLECYEALTKNQPPRGDVHTWKQRTAELLAAAKVAVKGNRADFPRLRRAVDCDSCHAQYKPPEQ
jgi:hypothetical protein